LKIKLNTIRSILLIQIRPYGDVLLNTPYLPYLRKTLPRARIDFLVQRPYHQLLTDSPYLDEIIVYNKGKGIFYLWEKIKLIKKIARRRYDLIIDQQNSNTSAQVVLFSGASIRIGALSSRRHRVYNVKAEYGPQRYSASMKFDMLAPLGIKEQSYRFAYCIQSDSSAYIDNWLHGQGIKGARLILISPGSPREYKRWKSACYAEFADMISERTGYKVVLIWAPGELGHARVVADKMHQPSILAPATTYDQAAALIKQCRLVVCNDGGLNHLAVALDIPSLAIFGNTNPVSWMPPERFSHHYFLYNHQADARNDRGFGISPQQAFEKVISILELLPGGLLPGDAAPANTPLKVS